MTIEDTPKNREQLRRYCRSRSLSEGSTNLLEHLADLTMKREWHRLTGSEIAAELYLGDRPATGENQRLAQDSAIHAARRLRREMDIYKLTEARREEILFTKPLRSWRIEYATVLTEAPVRRMPSLADRREEDHNISILEFKLFLEELCDLEGYSPDEVDERARAWWDSTDPFRRYALPPGRAFAAVMAELEKREDESGAGLHFSGMRGLADQLGIHPIMLDPLLSEEVSDECICLDFPEQERKAQEHAGLRNGKFEGANQAHEGSYGTHAQYYIPSIRLSDTGASFVYLVLRAGGHSDDHHHPGDEFLLVLRGCVEVRLADSGGRVQLHTGSFIHFYAEQTHSAHFVSGDEGEAHVFIIRFYQRDLDSNRDSRQSMRKRLRDALGGADASLDLSGDLFRGWILESAATPPIKSGRKLEKVNEIANRFGLARFLKRLPPLLQAAEQQLLAEINLPFELLSPESNYTSVSKWLSDLAVGKTRVSKTLIPALHRAYGMFRLLLWDFLFPGVIRVIVLHRDDPAGRAWVPLREVAPNAPVYAGVNYESPSRSLACSDVAISWVTIDPNKLTPQNDHPGCELLIPVKGEIAVVFGEDEKCRIEAGKSIAHYWSEKSHRALNPGSKPAEMLVIRFLSETRSPDATDAPNLPERAGAAAPPRRGV